MKALKVERMEILDGDGKRFLDIYYYTHSRIFNLRKKTIANASATEYNRGHKRTVHSCEIGWKVDRQGIAKPKSKRGANIQDLRENLNIGDYELWHQRFIDGEFKLVWTSKKKVKQ